MKQNPISLYIHWPFCLAKCPYCDFNSHVRDGIDESAWRNAYLKELEYYKPYLQGRAITSVFFGGGTPTLMPPGLVEELLQTLSSYAHLPADTEITLEGNPTSIEAAKLKAFKQAGVNRVSLGIQSLYDNDLRFLGREHSAKEALHALETAASLFERYSFDLIYARPQQTLSAWKQELKQAMPFIQSHASLYQLTIEKGTPFYARYQKGDFELPDEELSAQMYELTNATLADNGLFAYEISNYAKPGHECQHNLNYWRYGEYIGIGAGAHGRIIKDGKRIATMTIHGPEQWLSQVNELGHGLQSETELLQQEMLEEILMFGLRLQEGINLSRASAQLGEDFLPLLNQQKLSVLQKEDLLHLENESLKLSENARLLCNSVVAGLV